jgi:hypothetical protein
MEERCTLCGHIIKHSEKNAEIKRQNGRKGGRPRKKTKGLDK